MHHYLRQKGPVMCPEMGFVNADAVCVQVS